MATKNVNGKQVDLTPEEEEAVAAKEAAYDPTSNLKAQLIAIERENEREALITAAMAPKLAQISNMNEVALRAAITAGGLA